jgi:hypothetical protein
MKQHKQSVVKLKIEQCTIFIYEETGLQMTLSGNSRGNLHAGLRRLSESSPLRLDRSGDCLTGRLSQK